MERANKVPTSSGTAEVLACQALPELGREDIPLSPSTGTRCVKFLNMCPLYSYQSKFIGGQPVSGLGGGGIQHPIGIISYSSIINAI